MCITRKSGNKPEKPHQQKVAYMKENKGTMGARKPSMNNTKPAHKDSAETFDISREISKEDCKRKEEEELKKMKKAEEEKKEKEEKEKEKEKENEKENNKEEVKKSPEEAKKTPEEVKKTPEEVKKTPEEVKKSPPENPKKSADRIAEAKGDMPKKQDQVKTKPKKRKPERKKRPEEESLNLDRTEYLENAQLSKVMSKDELKEVLGGGMQNNDNDDNSCRDTIDEIDSEMENMIFSPLLVPGFKEIAASGIVLEGGCMRKKDGTPKHSEEKAVTA